MKTLKAFGKKFELPEKSDWKLEARPGGLWVATDSNGIRKRVSIVKVGTRVGFSVGGVLWQGEVVDRETHGVQAGGGDQDLVAQFPGKVRKILVSVGKTVAEGESLVLVEAMKMEFAIRAPCAGRVKKLLVQEGQQLSPGDRFLDFEEEGAHGR